MLQRAKLIGLAGVLLVGCGASYPVPHDQMAAATTDVGRAQESGAANVPEAKLHLQLAQEDLAKAKELMEQDNRRAASLIERAKAEAQYAIALAREASAKADAQTASDQLARLKGGK
jgi:hypothetical protein